MLFLQIEIIQCNTIPPGLSIQCIITNPLLKENPNPWKTGATPLDVIPNGLQKAPLNTTVSAIVGNKLFQIPNIKSSRKIPKLNEDPQPSIPSSNNRLFSTIFPRFRISSLMDTRIIKTSKRLLGFL